MSQSSHQVSVVIPAFNAERSLARAIESVLAQDRRPSEVIVVDDGSRDATAEIIKRYGDNVRYVGQANAGSSAARNRGIAECTQDWIAFLDADDCWRPEKLRKQFTIVDAGLPVRWIAGAYVVDRTESSFALASSHKGAPSLIQDGVAADALELMASGWVIWTGTVVVHRDVFAAVGNFDVAQRTSHDTDLWIRIGAEFPRIGYITDPLASYHANNPGSLATTAHAQHDQTQLLLYQRALETAANLPSERGRFIHRFLTMHANSAVKTALWEGQQRRAAWLLSRFTDLGIEMSNWLQFAVRIPPLFLVPVHRSFRVLSGRALRARLPIMRS